MGADPTLVLEIAVRRGLLSPAQAAECRDGLGADPDPVSWLAGRNLLASDEAEMLRRLVEELREEQARLETLVAEGSLSPSEAKRRLEEALPSPSKPAPLSTIGPYELGRELGQGGMGTVYAARDPRLGREVAIKILRGAYDDHVLQRFRREAQVVAKLDHPRIVRIFDFGEHNGTPYLVMPLIDGRGLDAERLPRREAVRVVHSAAEALHAAHERGVLHRDIKPSNILVDKKGEAYLADFGLAKREDEESSLTLSGQVFGTPAFMSPEQAGGAAHRLDRRSDVYGLGATLFFALTGRPPFDGATPMEVLRRVMVFDPPWPRRIDPTIHRDLEAICLKAMAKEPGRRYADAKAMAADLARFLEGEPISARPPSLVYRVGRWTRRHRVWAGSIAAVALLSGLAAWAIRRQARDTSFREAQRNAREARERGEWDRAKLESERGLALRSDPELTRIAAESTTHIRRNEAEKRRLRWLLERFRPLEDTIHETLPYFYIPGKDIRRKLDRLAAMIPELETIARDPENASYSEVWAALGLAWFQIGHYERALPALERAAGLNPLDPRVNARLAQIFLRRSVEAFVGAGGKIQAREGKSLEWANRALEVLRRPTSGWAGTKELDRHIASVYRAFAAGDRKETARLCAEGRKKFGDVVGSEEFFLMGALAHWVDDPIQVLVLSEGAIVRRPHYDFAYFVRGLVMEKQGTAKDARADFDAAIRLNPYFAHAYSERGILRAQAKDLAGALSDLERAVTLSPSFALYRHNRGHVRFLRREYREALADHSQAIKLDPLYEKSHYWRSRVRYELGDRRGAIDDLTNYLKLAPKDAAVYVERGFLRKEAGDLAGAREDFTRAKKDLPARHPLLPLIEKAEASLGIK